MKTLKLGIGLLLAVFCIVGITLLRNAIGFEAKSIQYAAMTEKTKGNPKIAKWRIVEYIDFECASCKFGSQILHEYMNDHPREFSLQVKYFPLSQSHAFAERAARYAESAALQGKFWEFYDLLFLEQPEWMAMADPEENFLRMAKHCDMDMEKLKVDLMSESVSNTIAADVNSGKALGVKTTPSYFINGDMVVGYKALPRYLEEKMQ